MANNTRPLPSQELLHELLDYDPNTGEFRWKLRPSNNRFNATYGGKIAGQCPDKDGYHLIGINAVTYRQHRIVWKWWHGTDPGETIDHVNRVRTDNRISNLADATFAENIMNRAEGRGYTMCRGRFQAQTSLDGRTRYIGSFSTAEEATEATRRARQYRTGRPMLGAMTCAATAEVGGPQA